MYQTVPRKYRPQVFADVLGQETIVTTLKNALRRQKLANAYLFCGSKGTGKTTLARVLAKALNCASCSEEQEPCDKCTSCREIASGRSMDVLEIDGASNRGIDDIRQINETVGYAPSGRYKIYIIDEVHMLTKEAFNALLKTLEEPPPNVKFFFATTEPHKVLPTIISRCQRFDLNRLRSDLIAAKLARIAAESGIAADAEALALIAQMSDGSLRDGEALFEQVSSFCSGPMTVDETSAALGLPPRALFIDLDKAIESGDISFAFHCAQTIYDSGKDLSYFCDCLLDHFRNHLVQAREQARSGIYTVEHLLDILDFLVNWTQKVLKNPFKRVGLEVLLLHLIRGRRRVSLENILDRLMVLAPDALGAESSPPPAARPAPVAPPVAPPAAIKPVPLPQPAAPAPAPIAPIAAPSPSLEEKLISAIKSKEEAPPAPPREAETPPAPPMPAPKAVLEAPAAPVAPAPQPVHSGADLKRYENLLRFTAVELEGTISPRKS